jgi:hypothetical protein
MGSVIDGEDVVQDTLARAFVALDGLSEVPPLRGPIPAVHGVVRCRRKDLVQWLFQEYRISVDETTIGRELKALGFAKLSARPRHCAQNKGDLESFKKTSPPHWQPSKAGSQRTSRSSSGGPTKLG